MKYMKGPHHSDNETSSPQSHFNPGFTANHFENGMLINPLQSNNHFFNNTILPWQISTTSNFDNLSKPGVDVNLFSRQTYSHSNQSLIGTGYAATPTPSFNAPLTNKISTTINEAILQNKIENIPAEQQEPQKIPTIDGLEIYSLDTVHKKYFKESNEYKNIFPENFNNFRNLMDLLRYAKILTKNPGYLFRIYQGINGELYIQPDKYNYMYISLCQAPRISEVRRDLPYMQLHPVLELLLVTLDQEYWLRCNPNDTMHDGELAATHCDKWVDKFRTQFRKVDFTEKIAQWENEPIKQYKDTISQFNLMLKNTDQPLNVARIDLSITGQSSTVDKLPKLTNALEILLNACRNKKINLSTKGVVWRIEYTERKAFHYHCIFFCDNTEELTQEEIIGTIGEYWKYTILKSNGIYFNCNDEPSLLRRKGSGVNDFSSQLINKLFTDEVLPMLTLVDLDLRVCVPNESLKGTALFSKTLETCGHWFEKQKR